MTDPDWEPIMKKAAGIITNRGGRTCHAAIVSREMGVACIVGTGNATRLLASPNEVTLSCAEGSTGFVYRGKLDYEKEEIEIDELPSLATQLMLNVGDPENAFQLSFLPSAGVGLARQEFIIAHEVKVHPLALVEPEAVEDRSQRDEIKMLCNGYAAPADYFIDRLAQGIAMIAAAFYPRPVIVRLSDFKTNEYANLLGGSAFEPREENPMIGFRGACRYLDERFKKAFSLECRALRAVREDMGLTNVKIMVPFCRTAEEGKLVLQELAANGLRQGERGLEVYVMCELPSNVLLVDRFAEIFNGFSIGSNDLTQLVLGVDRDSERLASLFDERDPAVLEALRLAIVGARKAGRKIGICGQAPSDNTVSLARFNGGRC